MSRRRAGQAGFLLLELIVVIAVGMAAAVWASHEWVQRTRDWQARALLVWMDVAQEAAQGFLVRYGPRLAVADQPHALAEQGYSRWFAPTLEELRMDGLLPAGWRSMGPLGHRLDIRIVRDTESCAQAPCRLQAVIHTRDSVTDQVDGESVLSEWMLAAAGRGFVVPDGQNGWLTGPAVRVALPADEHWAPGIIALVGELAVFPAKDPAPDIPGDNGMPEDMDEFLRMRDVRDPDFQGALTVAETMAARQVRSKTSLVARDSLVLEEGQTAGSRCEADGALGRSGLYPGLLQCRQGLWQWLARPAGGAYMRNSRMGCRSASGMATANPVTGACACPAGYLSVQISESGAASAPEGQTTGFLCLPYS